MQSLHDVAAREGLTSATPIIDLTGNGPGAALLLNGNAPYFPWALSIYGRGSIDLANAIWRSLGPREKHDAWFILPADPVFAHSEPMNSFMQDTGRYRLAARVPNMSYLGGPPNDIWVPNESARR